MEVVIGFAVGYWIGTRHGRRGLEQALDTARGIWESPQTRRALGEGLSSLQAAAPVADILRKRRDSRAALIQGVIDEIMEHRAARQAGRAA